MCDAIFFLQAIVFLARAATTNQSGTDKRDHNPTGSNLFYVAAHVGAYLHSKR